MPAAEYHAVDAVSSTLLRDLLETEATAGQPTEETEEMALGTLIHAMVLEPVSVDSLFACATGRRKMDDDGNPLPDEYGRRLFTPAKWERARLCAKALLEDPKVADLLAGAETEVSLFWTDLPTGLPCKARIDILSANWVCDLKTGNFHSDGNGLSDVAGRRRWPVQMLWYAAATREATGIDRPFCLVGIPTNTKYPLVGTVHFDWAKEKEPGLTEREYWWGRIVEALGKALYYRTHGWPTRATRGIELVELPRWAK
jgi:hypothetical protein